MTITRTDCPELEAVFPAWSFARSSVDGSIWVQRCPGNNGWIPLRQAVDDDFQAELDAIYGREDLCDMEKQAEAGRAAAIWRGYEPAMRRAVREARETADPDAAPLTFDEAAERARDMLIEEAGR